MTQSKANKYMILKNKMTNNYKKKLIIINYKY